MSDHETHAKTLEGLVGLSTVLTAIDSDHNRAALLAGAAALRAQGSAVLPEVPHAED